MNTGQRRSLFSFIPGYQQNAVLQVIIYSAVLCVALNVVRVVYLMTSHGDQFDEQIIANISLAPINTFGTHWWALLTYGWFHVDFFQLLSNMLWLYMFGSIFQMLVGYKQIIALFAYSLLGGGLCFAAIQLIPGIGAVPIFFGGRAGLGAQAGIMGLAAAAITISPNYRVFFGESFSVRLVIIEAIFLLLMLISSGFYLPVICLLAGGASVGFGYVKLLQSGYRPGEWIYQISAGLERMVTPANERHSGRRNKRHNYRTNEGRIEHRVDDILDKINQKGYKSLTAEERDILMRAGKEQ
jgi:membrane associated rhomboid family serine protease